MMISAEREQRDHQAVEKSLSVREEAFIQVARLFIMPLFFRRLIKADFCRGAQAKSYPSELARYSNALYLGSQSICSTGYCTYLRGTLLI
jgi:hypothetical protein